MPVRFFSGKKRKPPSRVVRPNRKRDEALQKQMAQAFSLQWGKSMKTFRQSISSDALADAYMRGDYSAIMKEVKFGRLGPYVKQAISKLQSATEMGASRALTPKFNPQGLRYDLTNPNIIKYLETRAGSLIQGVDDEFHLLVQTLVKSRFASGKSVGQLQMGLLDPIKRHGVAGFVLKNSVGLDTRSATALANKAASGKYTQKQLDSYENDLHLRRAKLIASTETSMAINEGQRQVWDEAAAQQLIDPSTSMKVWIVDGNPCPEICEPMDGVSVALNEEFQLPNGDSVMGPPAHPNCQCLSQLSIDGDDTPGSNRQNYSDS